jgi:signal transduction histidine kinase/ActR/RegA family two-component response regulator
VFVLKPLDEGRDFTVLGINNACRTLEGIKDKEEAIGKSILEVFPEMELSGLLDAMRRVWEGGNSELCSVSRNDGDKLIWCREYYVYKLRSGEIVTIFEDLTQRKKAEEEQMALQRQLVFSQKMESIGAFASGIAHNFRNILQAISGNTEYMEMTHSGETDITEVARCIHESVEKGVDLINNLLHFSRKGGDCELSDMDLCDAINSACEIIRKVFDKGIAITLDLEEGLMIKGNHSLLDQVFLNLFTNARDAMPNGGRLVIRAKRIAGSAVVTVKDTGIGIEPGVLGKIFDPFFTLKEVGKGSGLGLSTTLGIVQQHNGSITVSSEPDVGTTFKITLPSIDAVKVPAPEPQKRFVYGKGEKILIVDDDRTSLQALTNLTRKLRYETIPVDNPAQALKGYAAWSPDLTIMDRNMPGMDGVTCIREILKIDPDARVLIISGYDEDGLGGIDKSTKESIKGYLTKPCVIEDLSFQIYRALRGR